MTPFVDVALLCELRRGQAIRFHLGLVSFSDFTGGQPSTTVVVQVVSVPSQSTSVAKAFLGFGMTWYPINFEIIRHKGMKAGFAGAGRGCGAIQCLPLDLGTTLERTKLAAWQL